jgi:hypothetical protein
LQAPPPSPPDGGEPSAPRLRQGAVSIEGALPSREVERLIRQYYGRLRLCYSQGLKTNPQLAGDLSVAFVIDTQGDVHGVSTTGSTLKDERVVQCCARTFGSMDFPPPDGGTVKVAYTVTFSVETPPPHKGNL